MEDQAVAVGRPVRKALDQRGRTHLSGFGLFPCLAVPGNMDAARGIGQQVCQLTLSSRALDSSDSAPDGYGVPIAEGRQARASGDP
jgi:hypothetical protein